MKSSPITSPRQARAQDCGTSNSFASDHIVSALAVIMCGLVCTSVIGETTLDLGVKSSALVLLALIFILIGVTHFPNGPFVQPHQVLWRLVFYLLVIYFLMLTLLLFQSIDNTRQFMKYIDAELGQPRAEQNYTEDCRIYTPEHPNGTFANIVDNLDFYVLGHFFGWWLKVLMFRDAGFLIICCFCFELVEYTFQYQLPQLGECWWDHWILDFMICNCLGIWMGTKTCEYFGLKTYEWLKIPSPINWTAFKSCIRHIIIVVGVILLIQIQEVNTFYLEDIFWIPPNHGLTIGRDLLYFFSGACVAKETHDYVQSTFTDINSGTFHWTLLAVLSTIMEIILEIKFGWDIVTLPIPSHICLAWAVFFSVCLLCIFLYLLVHIRWPYHPMHSIYSRQINVNKIKSYEKDA